MADVTRLLLYSPFPECAQCCRVLSAAQFAKPFGCRQHSNLRKEITLCSALKDSIRTRQSRCTVGDSRPGARRWHCCSRECPVRPQPLPENAQAEAAQEAVEPQPRSRRPPPTSA